MFNVSWEDPASETVAQHRERKERDERNSVPGSTGSSLRSVESSESSRTQSTQLPAKSTKASNSKTTTPKRGLSRLKNAKSPLTGKRLSLVTTGASSDSQQTIKGVNRNFPDEFSDRLRDSVADTIQSAPLSNRRSNVTGSSWSSVTDNTSRSYEIQALTQNSFITRSTEVTTSPQDSITALNAPMNEVSVSTEVLPPDDYTLEIGSETFQFPRVPGRSTLNEGEGSAALIRQNIETTSSGARKPAEFWKPPTDWGCLPDGTDHSQPGDRYVIQRQQQVSHGDQTVSSPGPSHLQKHIRRMQSANPKIMLERIKEDWTEIDVTMCKELEFEKHLWMLSALRYLGKQSTSQPGTMSCQEEKIALTRKVPFGPSKVLSLYENQASASFLATFTNAVEIHHIATSPLPPCPIPHLPNAPLASCSIPHVHPLTVPNPQPQLPFAHQLFLSISSLSLPTILPSSSIPPLLRDCYRVLQSSGTLYLTILDPLPLPATLGPRLRVWLEKHLVLNLEKHFRCMSPGRLLPIWLKDAGFSCNVTLIRFWATGKGEGDHAELTAAIGKMLWKEMWGGFLDGKKCWWDDEAVMEECDRLETRWECSLVEAVKTG